MMMLLYGMKLGRSVHDYNVYYMQLDVQNNASYRDTKLQHATIQKHFFLVYEHNSGFEQMSRITHTANTVNKPSWKSHNMRVQ